MRKKFEKFLFFLLRLSMGWIFLWSFLDRLFGLGFNTPSGQGWIDGVSPTSEFLAHATGGSPLAETFQALSGQPWVDWVFMIALAGIGMALILGIMMRAAGVMGAALSLLMYLASFPFETDPLMSYHLVYMLAFLLLATVPSGEWGGLGRWWVQTRIARGFPFLR